MWKILYYPMYKRWIGSPDKSRHFSVMFSSLNIGEVVYVRHGSHHYVGEFNEGWIPNDNVNEWSEELSYEEAFDLEPSLLIWRMQDVDERPE